MKKKIISILLALSLFAAAGCGDAGKDAQDKTAESATADGTGSQETGAEDGAGNDTNANTAMGRYVEQETELADVSGTAQGMYQLDDGSLMIASNQSGFWRSEDQGETWKNETPDWYVDLLEESGWIPSLAVAPDGTVCAVYPAPQEDEEDWRSFHDLLTLASPEGTRTEVSFPEGEEGYPSAVYVTEDNRIFVDMALSNSLYEVFRDGTSEKILTTEMGFDRIRKQGNLLFFDARNGEDYELCIYDLDKKEYVEDQVLADFMEENYKDRQYNGTDYGSVYFFTGEDSVIYIAGKKGLHRHVVGGNMMEQVIDGNLSRLSSPTYLINSMCRLEGDVFFALFTSGKLVRFTYDATVPTVPDQVLTVYSLEEDSSIRQAIAVYQAGQQDVFVNYEVGMEDGSGVTREDALKKLNTEVMAGTGPDLLVMDGLPFDSYVEKGLLLDMTDYFAEYSLKEPLFDNVIDALKKDGKAYVAPATLLVPMIVGDGKYVENMTDLSSIADGIEQMRADNPGKNIIDICSATGIMKRFSCVSAPLWQKEDGSLDEEILKEYLTECKRIYEAQMDGLDAQTIEDYNIMSENWLDYDGILAERAEWNIYMEIMAYVEGEAMLPIGWQNYPGGYADVVSTKRVKGYENSVYQAMKGQSGNVFMPETMLAVSAASAQTDMALDFMDVFLSTDVQSGLGGYSINRQAFAESLSIDPSKLEEDGSYSSVSTVSADGVYFSYTIYWPSEEEVAALTDIFNALDTPYLCDDVLQDAVFAHGEDFILGKTTLENAVAGIEKQVSVYMAE